MTNVAKIRILLIEDSETDALLLRESLAERTEFDHELIHASSLTEGIARVQQNSFQVVLLDLGLPDSQGLDTLTALCRHVKSLPVLVLTGLEDFSIGLQAIQHGAQDFLIKKDLKGPLLDRLIRYAIERHQSMAQLRTTINSNVDAMMIVDADGAVCMANPAAAQMFGLDANLLAGQPLGIPLVTGRTAELSVLRPDRTAGIAEMRVVEIDWGETRARLATLRDITERKKGEDELRASELRLAERTSQLESVVDQLRLKKEEVDASNRTISQELKEKCELLREVHHRVNNNFQVVQGILRLSANRIRSEEARTVFDTAVRRIAVMAKVQNYLYSMPSLESVSVALFLRDIADGAIQAETSERSAVHMELDIEDIPVGLASAVPLGLLTNELVSNSVKHALHPGQKVLLRLQLNQVNGAIRMVFHDNGPGLPEGFRAEKCTSIGLKLASSFAHQLGGKLTLSSDNGCRVQADFKGF